jgi:membrane-bound metal-dependent hydrolase YbcI (DUF457 family)
MIERKLAQDPSFKDLIITSILGVWFHVLLDAFLYEDLTLLYPLHFNPLLDLISTKLLNNLILFSFPSAIILYYLRVYMINKKQVTLHPSIKPESGTEIKEKPNDLEESLTIESEIKEPELTSSITQEEVSEFIPFIPEIFIGTEKTPNQWGIIGKAPEGCVAVDLNEPHIVFVSGKQGSGKGYTIGVISEMLLSKSIPNISNVKKPATIIVFHKPREDFRSEYWSIIEPNKNDKETDELYKIYGVRPGKVINDQGVKIFVDPYVYQNERKKFEEEYNCKVYPIGIKPSGLTAEDWPYVLSIGKRTGSIYVKKIFQIIKKTQYDEDFGLDKIREHIEVSDLNPNQKSFANMRLETLQDYLEMDNFLDELRLKGVNIFDLRKIMMEPDDIFSVMILVISAILNNKSTQKEQFVFVINEAHDYLRKGLSKDFTDYVNYLIRKKRHAGTWLMLDTHFPEDVDPKVIKGSDIKIFHMSDVLSSKILKQIVDGTPIPPYRLETGQAIIRADKSNLGPDTLLIVKIRPRITHHGGATKTAI